MRCLAIDFGSSTIKGAVLDLGSGDVCHVVRSQFPEAIKGLPSGFYEVCPQQIVDASRSVIERLIQLAPEAKFLVSAGQMGGCILVDKHQRALSNYLSWRDQRSLQSESTGASYLQTLRQRWSDEQFMQLGCELKPGSATALLYWLQQMKLINSPASVVSIGDFVLSQLCGCKPKWNRTMAIGLLNLSNSDWHYPAFEAADLGAFDWPEIAVENEPIGKLSGELGGLYCYSVVGDQQAALMGVGLQASELSINCSTGSQVSRITQQFTPGNYQSRYWFDGGFLNTVTHIPAGRSLTVLHDLLVELAVTAGLTIENSWQLIAAAASRAAAHGPVRSPVDVGRDADDQKSTNSELICDLSFFDSALGFNGRIEGITTENFKVGNLFEAAFEYMADSYSICAKRLDYERTCNRLVISGGLVQNFPTLRTRLHQRFSLPIREVATTEETLLGLLTLARRLMT